MIDSTANLKLIRTKCKELVKDIQWIDNPTHLSPISFIELTFTLVNIPKKVVELIGLFTKLDEQLSYREDLPNQWGPRGSCNNCGSSCGCAHNFEYIEEP